MFSATHKMIAEIVCDHIHDELGVTLDFKAFRYGSIAPDLKLSMRTIKHTRKGSFGLVKELGNGLIEMKSPIKKMSMRDFSYKLGVIIHFVCDYFCTPHNDRKYKNIIRHLRYEKRLERYALKRRDWNIPTLNEAIVNNMWKDSSFEQIIVDKTKEYHDTSASFYSDMEFAIIVSTMAALNIVKTSLANNRVNEFDITGINFMPA